LNTAEPLEIVFRFAFSPMMVNLERHAVDCFDDAVVGSEMSFEVLDFEEGHGRRGSQANLILGSITAYRRSTIRLKMMIASVANTTTPWVIGKSKFSRLWMTVRPRPGNP
jgi:hypothetical protein